MPPAALERPAGPVAAAAAMAPIVPAVPSLAAFFKKSRLCSIAFVHTKKTVAASTVVLDSPVLEQQDRFSGRARSCLEWRLQRGLSALTSSNPAGCLSVFGIS